MEISSVNKEIADTNDKLKPLITRYNAERGNADEKTIRKIEELKRKTMRHKES